MLPAREGDCILITYGETSHPYRVLVDGGRAATYAEIKKRVLDLPEDQRSFELLVVTHVDRDHIEGALAMVMDEGSPATFKDIWFNSYDHLKGSDLESFGAVQGERLTDAILNRGLPWNEAFGRRSVELRSGSKPVELNGGMTITLLSPDRKKLEALIPDWEKECEDAGLMPGGAAERPPAPPGMESFGRINIPALAQEPFDPDHAPPNGTSIAFLAEYENRRVLLAADAHADRLVESLLPLAAAEGGRIRLDAFKLPHHGSNHNVSKELLDLVACNRFLVSSNGSYFDLPDPIAMSRVIVLGGANPQLIFNYRSPEALLWDNQNWKGDHGYSTSYPSSAEDGTKWLDL